MEDFTEQEDQWLRDALHSVSSPVGLRERIRSRLRQELAAQANLTELDRLNIESAPASPRHPIAEADGVIKLEVASLSAKTRSMTRRQWVGMALALSIAALTLGAFQWSRPFSAERLAQLSLTQLDQVIGDEVNWRTEFDEQLSDLAVLNGQLLGNILPLGYQDRSGSPLAEQCRIWKLQSNTTHKSFYVFDFQDARTVGKLTSQLQAINRVSGGWSVVAMRSGDRVLVVLFEGAVDSYLYRRQSA